MYTAVLKLIYVKHLYFGKKKKKEIAVNYILNLIF